MSEQAVRETTRTTSRLVIERLSNTSPGMWLYYAAWDDSPDEQRNAELYLATLRDDPHHRGVTFRLLRRTVAYVTTEEVVG